MSDFQTVGKSVSRIDFPDKVTGSTKYTNDFTAPGLLHAKMVISPYAHAKIKKIDTSQAWSVMGVQAIVTGEAFPVPVGPLIADRPPLAVHKVRYYGEPVAVVVADSEHTAKKAAELLKVEYEPLPVVNSPSEALQSGAPLVHENVGEYQVQIVGVYPKAHTNIANHTKIRKGNMTKGWAESEVIAEANFSFAPSDHAAMETRCVRAEIRPDGRVIIYSASQGPFIIKKYLHQYFKIDLGKIIVHTPSVGGAFGGKGCVQLEFIAYLASRAVGGKMVKLVNSREEDLISSPVHIGLEATVKLGATREGKLMAAEYRFLFDGGAYSDMAAGISKAAAVDCTGPYRLENVWCDSYCMYTNHTYATSFRGFGHPELTFIMERTMDILAGKLQMDPLELRMRNVITPGDTTPTQTVLTRSNIGDVAKCMERAKQLIQWEEGQRIELGNNKVKAKGISCIWKTSSTPPNAGSGAVLTFNSDGSINLNCAAVEIGQGAKTVLAQIVAEKMKMNMNQIHVSMDATTQYDPHQWKTVASTATIFGGRAVLAAAEDATRQLLRTASIALRCLPEDMEVGGGSVFLKDNPDYGIQIKDIALGYKYPNGNSVGGQVIGRGAYIVKHLTPLEQETGYGKPGPQWTVGAQAVEVELDTKEYTYKITKAVTVLDAGKVINPQAARGQMTGGMCMGLGFASRESFLYNDTGIVQNPQLRDYKLMRFGEQPDYEVDFVETPFADGPYGARGIGEYGVIGMPASLANSLSAAARVDLNQLPLTPEYIWKTKEADNG